MPVRRKLLLRALLLLLLAAVVGVMVLPYSVVSGMMKRFGWIGDVLDFLDTIAPGLEMSHLLAFAALGFLARFAWPKRRPAYILGGVLAVAVFVEIVQVWVPGRQAAVSHALLETLGGVVGFAIAWVLTYAWGTESLPDDYKPSTHWT
ncbi:MAG TPA: VanZ family protein, partial [Ramlibacter sp.]|uniref:VanZ family protein n=1 Tax=Ramlibacter sp. TaxID=1917967 RepID=UPI002D7EE49B